MSPELGDLIGPAYAVPPGAADFAAPRRINSLGHKPCSAATFWRRVRGKNSKLVPYQRPNSNNLSQVVPTR
jgi:hypothetical protein